MTVEQSTLPSNMQVCPLSNPCIGYPLVHLSSKVVENQESWPHLRSVLYYTFYVQGTAWWFDPTPYRQKKGPFAASLTSSLHSYCAIWKGCIINKNFDCTIYPIWPPNCIRAFGFLSWPSFHESSPPGAAMQTPW